MIPFHPIVGWYPACKDARHPSLLRASGRADNRHGRSRFPIARITFLTRWGAEAVTAYRLGPYRQSEEARFHTLWDEIPMNVLRSKTAGPRRTLPMFSRFLCSAGLFRLPHGAARKGKVAWRGRRVNTLLTAMEFRGSSGDT